MMAFDNDAVSAVTKFSRARFFLPKGISYFKVFSVLLLLIQQSQLNERIIILFFFLFFSRNNKGRENKYFYVSSWRPLTTLTKQIYLTQCRGPGPSLDLYMDHVCMLQKRFWLNRRSPQNERLKKGITEKYVNCLKNTCNGLKYLS